MTSRKNVPKTKTFAGCWTCRIRKVKCDYVRPECLRCAKAGLKCGGYQIRLCWVKQNDATSMPSLRRDAMVIDTNLRWDLTEREVDESLREIDQGVRCGRPRGTASGPFGVFCYIRSDASDTSSAPFTTPNGSGLLTTHLKHKPSKSDRLLRSDHIRDDNTISLQGMATVHPSLLCMPPSDNLPRAPLVSRLMEYYLTDLVERLQPVPRPGNFYRTIYIPLALREWANESNPHDGDAHVSFGRRAVFWTLQASAAFHLSGLTEDKDLFARGHQFRLNAIRLVNKAMDSMSIQTRLTSNSMMLQRCHDTLAAIMTLITADILEGSLQEYWVHLAGVAKLEASMANMFPTYRKTRFMPMFSLLTIIAQSTVPNLSKVDPLPVDVFFEAAQDGDTEQSEDLIFGYGITPHLANLLNQATILAKRRDSSSIDDEFRGDCARFEACLKQDPLDGIELHESGKYDADAVRQAVAHVQAYHNSIKIYFYTRAWACDPETLASYVSQAAESLFAVEKTRLDGEYKCTTSIAWPGFMASCEAEPNARDVWRKWWAIMQSRSIRTVPRMFDIVQRSWELRDLGDIERPAWLRAVRDMGGHLFAL